VPNVSLVLRDIAIEASGVPAPGLATTRDLGHESSDRSSASGLLIAMHALHRERG